MMEGQYDLVVPVEIDGETVTSVTVSRVKVKDVRNQDKEIETYRASQGRPVTDDDPVTSYDCAIYNIAKAINRRMDFVEELDYEDFSNLSNRTRGFFGYVPEKENAS